MCGIDGCTYKTGNTGHMKRHKGAKHNVVQVWKDDGKERDKQGQVLRACGIGGCTYRTGHTTR